MKKFIFIPALFFVLIGFLSCDKDEALITPEAIVGKWHLRSTTVGFGDECESIECVTFYADSTLLREGCSESEGTWYIENDNLYFVLDESEAGDVTYTCKLYADGTLEVKFTYVLPITFLYTKE